jgi:putative ATP-dependent endonuclease of the OLD family
VRIRRLSIERYRGLERLVFSPGPRTIILGPNNSGKTTVVEALDLLLYSGLGRPRPSPTELDYFGRRPTDGFSIEAALGALTDSFAAEVREHLEGWNTEAEEIVPEPGGDGVEPVVRVRVRGDEGLDVVHEFAKPESGGARFPPRLRAHLGWVFDGRMREPARQLNFFQSGLLERLFAPIDLSPAVDALRDALAGGAAAVNEDADIQGVLAEVASDLTSLGLISPGQSPQFEVGGVSERELLQAMRLSLPSGEATIPVARQGRGAQRLLLVALLLRIAQRGGVPAIGGFEEPEEALEPLRQTQVARMLAAIADAGGQIFVVTHSPEIARAFAVEDILLLEGRGPGEARALRKTVSEPMRQKYERWLERGVVRALFAQIPLLVEGPGDRAVVETFWRALADEQAVLPAEQLRLDVVNCEGAPEMPAMAQLLAEAGKSVVVWAEQDRPDILETLRNEGHCAGFLLHDPEQGRRNLEEALAVGASLDALGRGMSTIADGRGYDWSSQRDDLVSRAQVAEETREAMKAAASLPELLATLGEAEARDLVAQALGARGVTPFEIKGARQARLLAEAIAETDGVPESFARPLRELEAWIRIGCPPGGEFPMSG